MTGVELPKDLFECKNFIAGEWCAEGPLSEVVSPYTGKTIGRYAVGTRKEWERAVEEAAKAQQIWGGYSAKDRAQVLFRFRELLLSELDSISNVISLESGKLHSEARAGLLKGIEVLEFATSLQNLDVGGRMEVSNGVSCEYRREPLGVVAGITPFNFPAMVPMWMIPIALALGNSFVWKPSDKTPLTPFFIANALTKAGLPKGALTVFHGGREAAEWILDDSRIDAVGFVGSTPVARAVYTRGTGNGKRVNALGGAKNHIILMPDADVEISTSGILASFTGCAGQRCMAGSVLLTVGKTEHIVNEIAKRAKLIVPQKDMGAIISKESLARLHAAIDAAVKGGAKLLADGREFAKPSGAFAGGNWLAPTILGGVKPGSQAACEELFGPVLSVVACSSLEEALSIENENPYGNAASVFTTSGGVAEEVAHRARAGMVGVNIGVPVPREPFSFGGFYDSKFGHGDITGHSSLDFWSRQKKVTMKWSLPKETHWMN